MAIDRELDDGAGIVDVMDGDLESARSMAELFFETGGEQIEAVSTAVGRRDMEAAVFNAHKSAGGAAACGFERLATELRLFENAGAEMDWPQADSESGRLVNLLKQTRRNVDAYFKARMETDSQYE